MCQLLLGQRLGTIAVSQFQRRCNEDLVNSLAPRNEIAFHHYLPKAEEDGATENSALAVAHPAGVNCLAIDHHQGQFLFSGGADASVRLWDLDPSSDEVDATTGHNASKDHRRYAPQASLSRTASGSHTHALTSMSVYPFDPTPSTLLTTSYDKTLKVTAITPMSLSVVHTFGLDFLPYTHALSSAPDASPLIAVGTAHPAIRLLDLRSGLATHSLSGPNGAVYTVCWSPRTAHLLASGSTDGRVLFFDIRRANAAFASLDLDDAVGVVGDQPSTGLGSRRQLLDFHAVAHNGPVTSVQWTPSGDRLVTSGHDQRIRVWDSATGRNELVHFGPRIRNDRHGELKPLVSPLAMHRHPGGESLFWANDDGRGQIFEHHLREGHLLRILRTEGLKAGAAAAASKRARLTSGGRVNAMVWRRHNPVGAGLEMYTAHGDGRICAWLPSLAHQDTEDDVNDVDDVDSGGDGVRSGSWSGPGRGASPPGPADSAEARRKRKRDLIGDLVEGLARRPVR